MPDDDIATAEASTSFSELPVEFLTPEQRLDAIAEILAAVTIRVLKKRHDQDMP
jgi:hypothetical protein